MVSPAFGIYLHIPFCRDRCSYCSFYSSIATPGMLDCYMQALESQLRFTHIPSSLPYTLYFGGGTPSLYDASIFASIIDGISRKAGARPVEVTVECNPDIDVEYVAGLQLAGVTRLSVGVQSASKSVLQQLGRRHATPAGLPWVLRHAQSLSLQVSIDCIAGIPGTEVEQAMEDLRRYSFADHISLYVLSLESDHHLACELDGDFQFESFSLARDLLVEQGFEWYEIASFSRPGKRSLHNSLYWSGEPYIAMGAGAAGFSGATRYRVPADVHAYCQERGLLPFEIDEYVSHFEYQRERVLLGLRTADGVEEACLNEWSPNWRERLSGPWRGCLEPSGPDRWRIAQDFWLNYSDVVGHFFH